MKKLIFCTLLLFPSLIWCYGQEIKLQDIRQQIKPILISIGEVPPDWDHFIWPTIMIVRESDNQAIQDENFIPEQEFAVYRVARLAPHRVRHYIIVCKDRGYFINMDKPLSDIISDVLSAEHLFSLIDSELMLILNTVYKGYIDNKRSVYIDGNKSIIGPVKNTTPN